MASTAFAGSAGAQSGEQIQIVGSSTVFPFAQVVVEEFGNQTDLPAPVIESTGSGGGLQIFCEGIGQDFVDITNASRAIKEGEFQTCQENGVDSITEVQIGNDGLTIALAQDGPDFDLTKAQLFQALAAEVPVDGELVANPYTNWSEIDPALPDAEISVFGPPPTSGTRDAFVELVMMEGCQEFDIVAEMDEAAMELACSRMRSDGPFIESGENDNLIVQRLQQNPEALGIFGYSFLHENQDTLKAAAVGGVQPTEETIADGSYAVSRPLFFYIKNAHRNVIPGMNEYIELFVSEDMIGPDGELVEIGLIPLSDERREEVRNAAVEGAENISF
jgi:phosphate transport system substrate-binding protein